MSFFFPFPKDFFCSQSFFSVVLFLAPTRNFSSQSMNKNWALLLKRIYRKSLFPWHVTKNIKPFFPCVCKRSLDLRSRTPRSAHIACLWHEKKFFPYLIYKEMWFHSPRGVFTVDNRSYPRAYIPPPHPLGFSRVFPRRFFISTCPFQ